MSEKKQAKKIVEGFNGENKFVKDVVVKKAEFETFRDKIIDQLLQNVEIRGFRKGKAPREMALKQIDPQKLESTIFREVVDRYTPQGMEEIMKELAKDNRVVRNVDLDYTDGATGLDKDGNFKLRIVAELMPKIDLEGVEKIKIKEIEDKEIKDLPTFEEFYKIEEKKMVQNGNVFEEADVKAEDDFEVTINMDGTVNGEKLPGLKADGMKILMGAGMFLPEFEKEIKGMKKGEEKKFNMTFPQDYTPEMAGKEAEFEVKIVSVAKPKYKKVEDLIENVEQFKQVYATKQDFENDVKKVYEARVKNQKDAIFNKKVVVEVLKAVPDFEIDEDLIKNEADRIFTALKNEMETKNKKAGEILAESGMSDKDVKVVEKMNEDEVKKEIENYVQKEVKLVNILSYIYEVKLEQKPTHEELKKVYDQAFLNKQQFNLPANIKREEVDRVMMDRIIRQNAGNWLVEKIKKNSQVSK